MAASHSRSASIAPAQRMCFCGVATQICVSRKDESRGRRFYGYSNYRESGRYCGYFEWLKLSPSEDEAISAMNNNKFEDMSFLIEKNIKFKDKLEKMRREAFKWEMKVDRLKKHNPN